MALDGTSTLEQAEAQYRSNLNYDLEGSVAKAKLFIEAARWILSAKPTSMTADSGQGSDTLAFSLGSIQAELDRALDWYRREGVSAADASGSDVAFFGLENFRR